MNDLKWMKKPITIEAWQFTEQMALEYWHSRTLPPFGCNYIAGSYQREIVYDAYFYIDTLEGRMKACLGDWIIKGVKGEIYPCKPDIFEATYTRPKQPAQAQGVDESAEALLFIDQIAYSIGKDEWHDEFLNFYKPADWLNPRRAAAAFITSKFKDTQTTHEEP